MKIPKLSISARLSISRGKFTGGSSSISSMWKKRNGCAPHTGDSSGRYFDSNGNVCPTLAKEDVVYVAVSAAVCGAVLIVLVSIYVYRWRRSRNKERSFAQEPLMSSMASPLIPSPYPAPSGPFSRPLPVAPPAMSPSLSDSSSSAGPPSPRSLYSPESDRFHFPMLSADGHLLPPAPASSRRSWVEVGPPNLEDRPLPSPPALFDPNATQDLHKKRWSYRTEAGAPRSPVVGLYAGVEIRGDGTVERLADEVDLGGSVASSPNVAEVDRSLGLYQPQSAIYHRSFSAEGEDLAIYDFNTDDGHRRG